MGRLIAVLVVLVILAVFIGLNISYRTTVNIFGFLVPDAPSIIVIIASVVAGILLAIGVQVLSRLARRRRDALRLRAAAAEQQVRELAQREAPAAPATLPGVGEAALPAGRLSRLWDRIRGKVRT